MKKKIGIFIIRIICVLIIVSGFGSCYEVINGGSVAIPSSPREHSYGEASEAEGTEGVLCSIGIVWMGATILLMTKEKKKED